MVDPAWILSLMIAVQPVAPWRATYERTAAAIARQASASPVFDGSDGDSRSAAVLVGISRYESGFRIDAGGDCDATDPKTGLCAKGHEKTASSLGLFQINRTNFYDLGVTAAEMTSDPDIQARAALRMVKSSFRNCRHLPLPDRLSWYAAGRKACTADGGAWGVSESRTRMRLALRLFAERPPPQPLVD